MMEDGVRGAVMSVWIIYEEEVVVGDEEDVEVDGENQWVKIGEVKM